MDSQFYCRDCKTAHDSPAQAVLGYEALCLECALEIEIREYEAAIFVIGPAELDRPAVAA